MKQGMNQHGLQEREMPLLAGIGALVSWCEELLAILSGPLLTAGLALALIDLLTDGQLLARLPVLLYVWAASQAIGLDAQFIGAAAKLARAVRRRAIWSMIGYAVLCLALGYVGYLASNVFATQEANGNTTAEALARLGMDSTSWIVQRSLLAVTLVFLSGFLRYVAPAANVALSAEEERARLDADLMLAPLRAQKRAMQAHGMRGVVAAAMGRESPQRTQNTPAPAAGTSAPSQLQTATLEQVEQPPDAPPNGSGKPLRTQSSRAGVKTPSDNVVQMRATRGRKRRRKSASGRAARSSVEPLVRAVYTPGMTAGELARLAGVSKGAASKWRTVLALETASASSQAVQ